MRVAERLPVVAGHDDQRVVLKTGGADRVEQASQMRVGLVQDVQIAARDRTGRGTGSRSSIKRGTPGDGSYG